jgi:hypothetical protein
MWAVCPACQTFVYLASLGNYCIFFITVLLGYHVCVGAAVCWCFGCEWGIIAELQVVKVFLIAFGPYPRASYSFSFLEGMCVCDLATVLIGVHVY